MPPFFAFGNVPTVGLPRVDPINQAARAGSQSGELSFAHSMPRDNHQYEILLRIFQLCIFPLVFQFHPWDCHSSKTTTKDRTKTHKARTVELNARALAAIERQRARTQLAGGKVFMNPFTGKAWNNGEEQSRDWMAWLKRVGIRHRPPKQYRHTSVTMALQAGANPYWVAAQHGQSLQIMMKDYVAFIPRGDRGRNLAAVNAALGSAANQPAAEAGRGGTTS